MYINKLIISIILFSLVSCFPTKAEKLYHPIPLGTYKDQKRPNEEIIVLEKEIHFKIVAHTGRFKRIVRRKHLYTVLESGEITFITYESSSIIPLFDWYWDKKNNKITQKNKVWGVEREWVLHIEK